MKKAILIIDMPDSCKDCPLCAAWDVIPSVEEYYCTIENTGVDRYRKPDWYPLKELPRKKLNYTTSSDHINDFGIGYNQCINEILGN